MDNKWLAVSAFIGYFILFCLACTVVAAHHTKLDPIKHYIKQNEGYSNIVYEDVFGNLTVGYGHKLYNSVYERFDKVTDTQIQRWFENDFNTALTCARRYLNNNYDQIELTVITDMAFNLGCRGLNEFKLLRNHINNKNYIMAAKAIRYSNYYKQLENRADRNIRKLLNLR